MKLITILLLIYEIIRVNSYITYLDEQPISINYLRNDDISFKRLRKLDDFSNDTTLDTIYDTSSEYIPDIESDTTFETTIIDTTIDTSSNKTDPFPSGNYFLYLLLGFGRFNYFLSTIRFRHYHLTWFTYFRVINEIHVTKVIFTIKISYYHYSIFRNLQELKTITTNITCPLDDYKYNISKYNCSYLLEAEDEQELINITSVEGFEETFLFTNDSVISYDNSRLVLSPIGKESISNIYDEIMDDFETYIKDELLFSLDNSTEPLVYNDRKTFRIELGELFAQNNISLNYKENINSGKYKNIAGNYLFQFRKKNSKERIIANCIIKEISEDRYEAECTTKEACEIYVNQGIGRREELSEDNKNISLMFNITGDDYVRFTESSFSNKYFRKESSGLSGGAIAGIVIVCVVALVCISLLLLIFRRRKREEEKNNESTAAVLSSVNNTII